MAPSSSSSTTLPRRRRQEGGGEVEEEEDDDDGAAGEEAAPCRPLPPPPLPLLNFDGDESGGDDDYEFAKTYGVRRGAWGETKRDLGVKPPLCGTSSVPFLWPSPEHVAFVPEEPEPVVKQLPSVYSSLVAREMDTDERRSEAGNCPGRLVYHAMKTPSRNNKKYQMPGLVSDDELLPWYEPTGAADETLLFESRFESGNLHSAMLAGDFEYNLQLSLDINTDRHTQWYYFRIRRTRRGRNYKFSIQNLLKAESVYADGMQPCVYSEKKAAAEGVGWHRAGSSIAYYKNCLPGPKGRTQPFYTLTFTYTSKYTDDTVFFAHCYPYRYTDLQLYLSNLESDPIRGRYLRRRLLCSTLAGNRCELLTITSHRTQQEDTDSEKNTKAYKKRGVVLSARVHPGETNASWMMKGVLDFLVGPSEKAALLREHYVFQIVPMLNPDGVVVGNYRCSLAGADLNRQYIDPPVELYPTILHLKRMVSAFKFRHELVAFIDLHGHSRKHNVFMYGCHNLADDHSFLKERIFPALMDRINPCFSFRDCSFEVGKGKEGCGRVVLRKQYDLTNSFTLEASFIGADQGPLAGLHFDTSHFESVGHSLCECILDLQELGQAVHQELLARYGRRGGAKLTEDGFGSDGGSTSDSDNEGGGMRKPVSSVKVTPALPPVRRKARPPRSAPAPSSRPPSGLTIRMKLPSAGTQRTSGGGSSVMAIKGVHKKQARSGVIPSLALAPATSSAPQTKNLRGSTVQRNIPVLSRCQPSSSTSRLKSSGRLTVVTIGEPAQGEGGEAGNALFVARTYRSRAGSMPPKSLRQPRPAAN
jgi:hypothetical protein